MTPGFEGYVQLQSSKREYPSYLGSPQSGRLLIRNLPAGTYTLKAGSDEGEEGMTVTVPAASAIRFESKPLRAMVVRIGDESGLLGRAGFRTGDLVVGVNGQEFESGKDMRGKMLIASQKDEARLSVLRDGRPLEIPFDLSALEKRHDDLGGWLEPTAR